MVKDQDKVPHILYTKALKKLFDVIYNVNILGDVNDGKKYWLKRALA